MGRPPAEVWAFVADPVNDARWCPKVERVEILSPQRWVLVHRPLPLRPPRRLTVDHIRSSEPELLLLREEDEGSIFDVEYRLSATRTGTRMTQTSTFRFKRLPGFLQTLPAIGVRRDVRAQLRLLKQQLEGTA